MLCWAWTSMSFFFFFSPPTCVTGNLSERLSLNLPLNSLACGMVTPLWMLAVSRLSTEGKGVFKVKISSCLWLKSQGCRMPFPQVKFNWCVQGKTAHPVSITHKACSVSVKLRPAVSTVDVNLFHLTTRTSQDLVHWQTTVRICLGIAVWSVKKRKTQGGQVLVLDDLNPLDLLCQWGEPGATGGAGHKETGRI